MGNTSWTTLGLTKKQICFLDGISKRAKFSGGRKLSRAAIIRAFLRAAKTLNINTADIKDERVLRDRIIDSFKER